jgi:DNA-binding FadR family transcriptional regulator
MQNLSVEDELIFHTKIYQIAGNHFLLQLNSLMHPVFVFCKQIYESHFLPIDKIQLEKGVHVKHSDLFNFIKNRDKEGYREAIRRHLNTYWEFVRNKE